MGTNGRRCCLSAPNPLLHHLPGGGARPIGSGSRGWVSDSRLGGRARTGCGRGQAMRKATAVALWARSWPGVLF